MEITDPIEAYWNDQAATFDDEPDHGLTAESVRRAWSGRLAEWLPEGSCVIADLGCGTGSLSVLMAEAGHDVVGIDLSPAMIERARAKARAAGLSLRFGIGDVSESALEHGVFDVVLARHVIWTLPDAEVALQRWARLLNEGGRLVAVEGRWGDAGFMAPELLELLTPLFGAVEHHPLTDDARLWGRPVTDERYALIASPPMRSTSEPENRWAQVATRG